MPQGLCAAVARSVVDFPLRLMVVDNSGSMQAPDGNRLVQTPGCDSFTSISCSRWQELSEEVLQCASLAEALGTRFDVHLLNPRAGFGALSICTDAWPKIAPLGDRGDLDSLTRGIRAQKPGGTTPLTESVMQIVSMIEPVKHELHSRGERVVVIIATDGLPNDRHTFLQAMQALQTLPVWVVVRLCTDDDSIVDYWNGLDSRLEAPLEVLDDVRGEAQEVTSLNGWLTYGPALHLARMYGLPGRLYDAIDETQLVPTQIKEFIEGFLDCDALPEPQLDPKGFVVAVKQAIDASATVTCDPLSGRLRPWMDVNALERDLLPPRCDVCTIM